MSLKGIATIQNIVQIYVKSMIMTTELKKVICIWFLREQRRSLLNFEKGETLTFLTAFSAQLYGKTKPDETEKIINVKGADKSWIAEMKDFRLHYIAHNPKNPFELYYTKEAYSNWEFHSGKTLSDIEQMRKTLKGLK
jgi:hypothetical protein